MKKDKKKIERIAKDYAAHVMKRAEDGHISSEEELAAEIRAVIEKAMKLTEGTR